MHLWTVALIFIYILTVDIDYNSVSGLQRNVKRNDETKVKCKEVVDEALRQYWDHSKENGIDDDDDDDSDENKGSSENNPAIKQEDDDDNDEESCEEEKDSKEEDKDDDKDDDDKKDDNDDDDDDDDNDSEEVEIVSNKAKSVETKAKLKSVEQEDDDDDDSDEDEKKGSDKKQSSVESVEVNKQKDERNDKNDDKKSNEVEDDDDDDDDDDKDDKPAKKDNKNKDNDSEEDKEDKSDEKEVEEEEKRRSRTHIDDILRVYEIGSQEDSSEQNLILSIFREMKKLYETSVKPLEMIYKYRHITTRLITDAEMLRKQSMVLFLGGKSTGKTSLVNYLLGIDGSTLQLNTGPATGYPHFTVLSYGENYTRLSPTELSADYTFSSLQQFGQSFLENYIQAYRMPIKLLEKMTIVDSPGLIDPVGGKHMSVGQAIDNDVYQWFIDRSDVIYIVIDVTQIQLSTGLKLLIEQLKGRDVRFILSKTDQVHQQSQVVTIIGQLLWMLSPIMPSERPPQVFALTTVPQEVYDAFIDDQEVSWLKDLSNQISGINRVESRISALRRHAIRVRNHAKLVDCYLSTFYKNKGIFTFGSSSRLLASDITENPHQYRVYSGALAGQSQNISRYDLPDPGVYREFFRSNPLIDFKPLTSTCSYFKGCPIDKLDITIAYQLPELVGKYKKLTRIEPYL